MPKEIVILEHDSTRHLMLTEALFYSLSDGFRTILEKGTIRPEEINTVPIESPLDRLIADIIVDDKLW